MLILLNIIVFNSLVLVPAPVFGASAIEDSFTASAMNEVVNTYCVFCHSDTAMMGGMSLQQVDFENPANHAALLEKVVTKLRARMMPPSDMPRPEFEVYDQMTAWLETELDQTWADNPNPGRAVPVHRMNRYEYNNAVNDLLGLDVNVISLLPGDPTADGSFDNMAESLPFSTAYLERYMSVARQVTRLAIGLPPDGATFTTHEVPLLLVQDWRQNEDLPFLSRGGVSATHDFPTDGEYLLRVRLRTNWQDFIMGMGWPHASTRAGQLPRRPRPQGPGGHPRWRCLLRWLQCALLGPGEGRGELQPWRGMKTWGPGCGWLRPGRCWTRQRRPRRR